MSGSGKDYQEQYADFSPADIKAMEPMTKVGLLATVNSAGQPHLTLISSLQANVPTQMIFGQFTEGLSKVQIQADPRAGFLVMTLDRELWRGKATFSHTARQGPEFEMYNHTPMFRYNAYFGVHTVYYMDLVAHSGRQPLPMGPIVLSALKTILARSLAGRGSGTEVLNPWTRALMNKLDNLKFLAYVDADGYPTIVPIIQAQTASTEHILFSISVYSDELAAIPQGAIVAVFGMSLDMEDVLLCGEYLGVHRTGGVRCGTVQVNWVYNPMPPKPQQIYPQVSLEFSGPTLSVDDGLQAAG
jgi:hypothetical protein